MTEETEHTSTTDDDWTVIVGDTKKGAQHLEDVVQGFMGTYTYTDSPQLTTIFATVVSVRDTPSVGSRVNAYSEILSRYIARYTVYFNETFILHNIHNKAT